MDTAQLPGEILQHYAVQELLGAGAFAKIYRVEDRKSQEELALKVMRRSCYRKRCLEYQIDVELELTQLCQHRNVVTLRDVFDDGEFVIMLMSRATIDLQRATQKLVHMRSLERAQLLAARDSSAPPRKNCFSLADLLSGRWREKRPLGERQPPSRSRVVEPPPGKPSAAGAARRETSRRRGGQSSERASSIKGRRAEKENSSAPSPTRTPRRSIPNSQEFAASEVLRMILMSDCEPGSSVARELQNDPKQQLLPVAELAGGGGVAGATPSTSSPGSSSAVEHNSTAQVQQQKSSLLSDSLGPAWGEELSLFLFKQLVAGVEYIHRQGVLHRDLKPENILLKQEGLLTLQDINPNIVVPVAGTIASSSSASAPSTSSRNVFGGTSAVETETGGSSEEQASSTLQLQIADFGWSTKLHRTVGRALAGTYIYMSPEILDGRRHTASSDLWGAGMIWYFLLFGRPLLDQHCIRPGVTDGLTVYDPVRSAQTRARIVRAELNKLCPLRVQDKPEWLQEVVVHEPSGGGGGATSSSEDAEAEQDDVESSFAEVSEAEAERSTHDHARPSATQTTTRSPDGPPRAYVSTSSTKYFGWRTWLELRNLLSLVPNIRPSADELLRKLEGRVHRDRP